jgi:hypothetical protein
MVYPYKTLWKNSKPLRIPSVWLFQFQRICNPTGFFVIFVALSVVFVENYIVLYINDISDSKRQQTTTVDYKRLFNGLLLTDVFSLRHQI